MRSYSDLDSLCLQAYLLGRIEALEEIRGDPPAEGGYMLLHHLMNGLRETRDLLDIEQSERCKLTDSILSRINNARLALKTAAKARQYAR